MRPSGVPLVCVQLKVEKAMKESRRRNFMGGLEILGAIS